MKPYILFALAMLALTGCASTGGLAAKSSTSKGVTQPPVRQAPAVRPPVVANAEWVILGVSPNGNILHEIDKLSIRRKGLLMVFRDRKTIFNPKKENFLNTPQHKQSINTWEVDCSASTFRLAAMQLLDENGREILSRTYNDKEIRAMPVVRQSASFQQLDYVCKQAIAA
ncbi:surface-adhesin E family protein [Vogesella oryzae]|uniref:surface-adhesin E family protein n=1 Tax=Vogesella oryzae TaxID=1735285 RepID=UPI001582929E|nr:surface-adhesin E family protein [Vogesella oryzae]